MKAHHLLCVISAILMVASCNKEQEKKEEPVVPKIEIPTESQAVFSQGLSFDSGTGSQSQTVKFNATATWSAEATDTKASAWVTISPSSGGSGSVTMTVTAQPNTELTARDASVSIKCGTDVKKFTVKQAGVPVIQVESITLDKNELSLTEGEEATLIATVKPDNATDPSVTWTSSEPGVATVVDGKVTAIEEGTATITATAGEKSATCTVTVSRKPAPEGNIEFADPAVKAICVEKWDTNGDGELSYAEAASVESLGKAFYNKDNIVSFDEFQWFTGVQTLNYFNFGDCGQLRTITLPKYISSIEMDAFAWCVSLSRIDASDCKFYTSVDYVLFNKDMTELVCYPPKKEGTSYVVPETVKIIFDGAFLTCESLESITLNEGVTNIDGAFCNCTALKSIVIPSTITSIGEFAFSQCSCLTEVIFKGRIDTIELAAFEECVSLKELILPEGLIAIKKSAFNGCSSLSSIEIPNTLTMIGEVAFKDCSSLLSMAFPEGLLEIGDNAFSGCSSLKSVELPNSITTLGTGAFSSCALLNNVTLPNRILSVSDGLFHGCSSLDSIIIPDSVTAIGVVAFSGCSNLAEVVIPESVEKVGAQAFQDCKALKSVTVPGRINAVEYGTFYGSGVETVVLQKGVDHIASLAFTGANSLKTVEIKEELSCIEDQGFFNCSNLVNLTIPDTVTSIGKEAFYFCKMTSFTFPSGLTSISDGLFSQCMYLQEISDIPEGVTSIGDEAFWNCSRLKKITVPSTVTTIGTKAFNTCYSLEALTIKATNPPSAGSEMLSVFAECFGIYVPSGSVNAYKSAPYWSNYSNKIQAIQE